LYDIRPGNGAGPFLQPWSLHRAMTSKISQYISNIAIYRYLRCFDPALVYNKK